MSSKSLEERAKKAEKIKSNPEHYKICEGCDSIVSHKSSICPSCHSYRFDDDPDKIREQATLLASREQMSVIASDFE